MSDSTPTKRCSKCGVEYPATTEYFHRYRRGKSTLRPTCKGCTNKASAQYGATHREAARERNRRYRQNNPDRARESCRRYHKAHPEKARARGRRYYNANSKYVLARTRHWQKTNPEKKREHERNRRARVVSAQGFHTAADIQAQYEAQEGRCFYCGITLHGDYHIDHYIPLSRGGTNWPDNLVCACAHCNTSKQDKLPHEWTGGGRLLRNENNL